MKKSRFLLLCLSVASVVFLASCGNKAQTQAGSNANLTVNGVKIDLEFLVNNLSQATNEDEFNTIEKDVAATLGKAGAPIIFSTSHKPNFRIYEDTDFEFDDDISSMFFDYTATDNYKILEIFSRTSYTEKPCNIALADGVSIADDITKLDKSNNYYEVLNPFTYGDIYKTESDLITDFGKSYVAMYLDDQPINIASYENKLGSPLNNQIPPYIAFHNETNYNLFLRNPDIPSMVQELYKHDVLVSIAMDDCFGIISSGQNKKLFLVRIYDSKCPYRDYTGNDIICYLIEKNTASENE